MNPEELDRKLKSDGGRLLKSDFDSNDQLIAALVAYPSGLRLYTPLGISMYDWGALDNIRAAFPKQEILPPTKLSNLELHPYEPDMRGQLSHE